MDEHWVYRELIKSWKWVFLPSMERRTGFRRQSSNSGDKHFRRTDDGLPIVPQSPARVKFGFVRFQMAKRRGKFPSMAGSNPDGADVENCSIERERCGCPLASPRNMSFDGIRHTLHSRPISSTRPELPMRSEERRVGKE